LACTITGTGSYLPGRSVDNAELARQVTNFDPARAGCDLDAWIRRHYGVASRHWAAEGESTGDMATEAARRALKSAGASAQEVDLIVLSTATSDHVAPHSVSKVQAALGSQAVFHQLQDACPGFVNALLVAEALMTRHGHRRALVISAEKMTHLVDVRDFRMSGLFADGAGAVVLEMLPTEPRYGFQSFYAGSDGASGDALRVPAGGSARPLTAERIAAGEHFLISEFQAVYAFAVEMSQKCIDEATRRAGVALADVAWIIPHHASLNIIRDVAQRAGIDERRLILSIDHTGNTSSASVPTALDEAVRAGRIRDGDRVLLFALGGGMAWASTLITWAGPRTIAAARAKAR
jgi:3-oxoacyl-[acyl-carrier-protein] synthase-3